LDQIQTNYDPSRTGEQENRRTGEQENRQENRRTDRQTDRRTGEQIPIANILITPTIDH